MPLLAIVMASSSIMAQSENQGSKLTDEFLNFFIGNWSGDGEFANGKKISADLTFKISLDSSWMMYEHTDRLPNIYKALSMWGIDGQTKQFVAYAFDNFRGNRKFTSEGWKENKLILTTSSATQAGLFFQHFIYEKLSGKSFKMTYEVSKDGVAWKLGDYLVFNKK